MVLQGRTRSLFQASCSEINPLCFDNINSIESINITVLAFVLGLQSSSEETDLYKEEEKIEHDLHGLGISRQPFERL